MNLSASTDDHRAGARVAVEDLASAIATGDLEKVNLLLQPPAAADLARLAGNPDTENGPSIISFEVTDAGGSLKYPAFDIRFRGEGFSAAARVTAAKGAVAWRIREFLEVSRASRDPAPTADTHTAEPGDESFES